MSLENSTAETMFAAFFDESAYTPLLGGEERTVMAAYGYAGGQPAYAVSQTGAALAAADVAMHCKVLGLAEKTGNPVVTFYNAKGAVLEEGLRALQAAAKLNVATAKLSGVVPQIAVVVGQCGGSMALAAANADLCVMAEEAELFLTPPFLSRAAGDRVEGAGRALFAQRAGVAALTASSPVHAAQQAAKLVALLPGNNLTAPAHFEFEPSHTILDSGNYSALAAIDALADTGSAVVLYEEFGSKITTALATLSGGLVGIVATAGGGKGVGSNCATKAARFVRLCDSFSIPLVTVVDTDGFAQSSTADVTGGIRRAARLAATYADATTAKVAVFTGKAIGATYIAFGNADLTVAMEGAVIAPVEPSAAVSILHRDEIAAASSIDAATARLAAEYRSEVAGAGAALEAGLADLVATPLTLRGTVASALDILVSKRAQRLPKKHGNMAL